MKPVVKILEGPGMEEVADFVPVVPVDVLLFDEEGLLVLAEGNSGLVCVGLFFPLAVSLETVLVRLRFDLGQLYEVDLPRVRGQ